MIVSSIQDFKKWCTSPKIVNTLIRNSINMRVNIFIANVTFAIIRRNMLFNNSPLQTRSLRPSQCSIGLGANTPPQAEKDFVYILKRLQQPNKLIRGLRIVIPEMFCVI